MVEECIRGSNYLQLQRNCSKQHKHESLSLSLNLNATTLPKEKRFNDPKLPKHIDENTTFGIPIKNNCLQESSILDVIFPDKLVSKRFGNDEDETEFYKNYKSSHRTNKTGKQFNRKYTTNFNPDYRYGITSKSLPAGVWFKNNVQPKPSNESENVITDFVTKILDSENNGRGRYPYVDNRQGKFLGRSYLRAVDIITRNEPDEQFFDRIELLSAINKIKHTVKKKQHDLKAMLLVYEILDEESTGWLPIEQVYEVCYQHQIRPDKKLFDVALESIHAINNDRVRYDLFMDLLDPNVQFSMDLKNDNRRKRHEYISTYKNDYENRSSQNVRSNKKIDYTSTLSHSPVKPIVFAHQDCLGSETDVKTLLSPTIFTLYGLTYRDFYIERSKETIQKLFNDAGINLPNEIFNLIWDIASQKSDNDGKVNIEGFRQALRDYKAGMIDRQE